VDFATAMLVIILTVSAAVVFIVIFLVMRFEKRKRKVSEMGNSKIEGFEKERLRIERSVSFEVAKKAREQLRTLELEREILSDAIRKLYEAQAEGKISEGERDKLLAYYKERMINVKEAIDENQSIVALHELEAMQEDLIKLFNERFDELNRKIEELRGKVQVTPVKEIKPIQIAPPQPPARVRTSKKTPAKKRKRERKKTPETKKSEVERRIEEIKAEIEKVLARLGQMEVEA